MEHEWKRIARALTDCRSFLEACDTPVRVYPMTDGDKSAQQIEQESAQRAAMESVVNATCHSLGVTPPALCQLEPGNASSLEIGLSRFLALSVPASPLPLSAEDEQKGCTATALEELLRKRQVWHKGSRVLSVYEAGEPSSVAVLLVPPCGVPAVALRPWMQRLGEKYLTLTWESDLMFSQDPLPALTGDPVQAICDEITNLIAAYDLTHVHLIGICGGAASSLLAAVQIPAHIASLSICHGDIKVGDESPRTPFQEQFEDMLYDAQESVEQATSIYETLLDPGFALSIPARLGPFVLYPYTRFSLFQRYALINSALMNFDALSIADQITCPVLLLTSQNDRMAHPEPSRRLAGLLSQGTLLERSKGDHLDVLLEDQELLSSVSDFIESVSTTHLPARSCGGSSTLTKG